MFGTRSVLRRRKLRTLWSVTNVNGLFFRNFRRCFLIESIAADISSSLFDPYDYSQFINLTFAPSGTENGRINYRHSKKFGWLFRVTTNGTVRNRRVINYTYIIRRNA